MVGWLIRIWNIFQVWKMVLYGCIAVPFAGLSQVFPRSWNREHLRISFFVSVTLGLKDVRSQVWDRKVPAWRAEAPPSSWLC